MSDNFLKDQPELTLEDVCECCGLSADTVITYVHEGLVDVRGKDATGWRFSQTHMVHIKKASRLEQDLRLNPAGSVLVLELLSQIDDLKNQIKRFEQQQ